jgi:tetratricopeptide (TPR) repeat protein
LTDHVEVLMLFDEKTRRVVRRFEATIARDPGDAEAHLGMGLWWHWSEMYAKASTRFERGVEFGPGSEGGVRARAGLLATCPDPAYRDGEAAVRDAAAAIARARATRELTINWKHRMFLETLAAALAELGDFEAAAEVEREALRYCITRINEETAQARIAQFQRGERLRLDQGLGRSSVSRRPAAE